MSAYTQQSKNIFRTWLLMFIFIGLVSSLSLVVALLTENTAFIFIGLFISLFQSFVAYFFGDKIALASAGAKRVSYEEYPQVYEITQNLAKIAGIPLPKIHISPDLSANAFACGRNPKNASICLNQGLLNLLNKAEIEAVIAHELAHIKNRDILVMTVTMVLTSLVSFLADMGFYIFMSGRGNDRQENNSNNGFILFLIYIALSTIAPVLSAVISMAVSRKREYLADATAVIMTRYPEGLINALTKLYNSPVPTQHYSTSMNHFYISPPKKRFGEKISGLFSTHPPIKDRIKALQQM
jgi:heat shock protein HtpX